MVGKSLKGFLWFSERDPVEAMENSRKYTCRYLTVQEVSLLDNDFVDRFFRDKAHFQCDADLQGVWANLICEAGERCAKLPRN